MAGSQRPLHAQDAGRLGAFDGVRQGHGDRHKPRFRLASGRLVRMVGGTDLAFRAALSQSWTVNQHAQRQRGWREPLADPPILDLGQPLEGSCFRSSCDAGKAGK